MIEFSLSLICLTSRYTASSPLPANIRETKVVNFSVRDQSDSSLLVFILPRYFKTCSTSQMKIYFGEGGLILKIPVTDAHTCGCCPMGLLFTVYLFMISWSGWPI